MTFLSTVNVGFWYFMVKRFCRQTSMRPAVWRWLLLSSCMIQVNRMLHETLLLCCVQTLNMENYASVIIRCAQEQIKAKRSDLNWSVWGITHKHVRFCHCLFITVSYDLLLFEYRNTLLMINIITYDRIVTYGWTISSDSLWFWMKRLELWCLYLISFKREIKQISLFL